MKLVRTNAELVQQQEGLDGLYKHIELCGRTCYKSTDKITEDSAKPFVDRMINSHHTAMLEHGTVYLKFYDSDFYKYNNPGSKYNNNKYSKTHYDHDYYCWFVTTNLRVLVENNWLDDLQYICDPTEFHEMRYSFKLTTSIGVTRELNRHRVNSIAEQSTRYCNYSKDRFGNEVKFIIPEWWKVDEEDANATLGLIMSGATPKEESMPQINLVYALKNAEISYMLLTEKYDWSPQQAREVLPLCTATEIVHTAFASDWRHFFDLRLFGKTGNPHPNMLLLAQKMKAEAEDKGVWNDIMRYHSKF